MKNCRTFLHLHTGMCMSSTRELQRVDVGVRFESGVRREENGCENPDILLPFPDLS